MRCDELRTGSRGTADSLPTKPWRCRTGWQGDKSYLFDERVNATNEFETQAYTSLMQVGDDEAYVTYGKYVLHRKSI